jgi:glycosyltransferase involved in cell wall biosynthesis
VSEHFKPVSVIIPTWNRKEMIVEAIHSVRKQTRPNIQIIVVDDGSTDGTFSSVSRMNGILYLHQAHKGQGSARNLGLSRATGDYIATLDSDDLWEPEFLDRCIHALENLNADFVFANWGTLRSGTSHYSISSWEQTGKWKNYPVSNIRSWHTLRPEDTRRLVLECCPSPSSGLVFRRQSIACFWNERMHIADDWCLLMDLVLCKPLRTAFTMERLWTKRINGDNLYDGADARKGLERLALHDLRLMLYIFDKRLVDEEKNILSRHIIDGSLGLSRRYMKVSEERKKGLRLLASSLAADPAHTIRRFGQFLFGRHAKRSEPLEGLEGKR